MKRTNALIAALAALSMTACSGSEPEAPEPPSNLDINSAKRQCSNMASVSMVGQGVPEEAIEKMCGCTIDRLVETGEFTADGEPDDASTEEGMNHCLEQLEAELLSDAVIPAPEAEAGE